MLRTVPETPRQPVARPYTDFIAHVGNVAAAATAFVIDSFGGTWSGVRAGVLYHHDSTRTHFSDTGRAYLAQLTLNALPHLLSVQPPTPTETAGEIHVDRIVQAPPHRPELLPPPPRGRAQKKGLRAAHGARANGMRRGAANRPPGSFIE